MPGLTSLHLLIQGRVQGVGYRDWLVAKANGLRGWVRNLGADNVEAVICGEDGAVTSCVAACHTGPRFAAVHNILTTPCPPPDTEGFARLPSMHR
jgi:acylphosphatase